MASDPTVTAAAMALVRARKRPGAMLCLGICGAQGSGKSTLAETLEQALAASGMRAATLSLDDLYLTRAERRKLAEAVHPLLATRGVPGTHDVALGVRTIEALRAGHAAALPRFDKGMDDRSPEGDWPVAGPGLDVLVFEGWCIGARPQAEAALVGAINALEREEDAQGVWRRYANAALAGPYRALFGAIDALVLLAAPGFEIVARWRGEQEDKLRAVRPDARGLMDEAGIARFVQFYERLTRHILAEMPARADLVVRLGEARQAI